MRKLHFFSILVALSLATTNLWALPTGVVNGKLPGVFRAGCDVYVYFSQGNLQYIGSASTPYWKFAEEQCIFLGDNQTGTSSTIDRDLFGYGQSQTPWKTSTKNGDYSWQGDWGRNVISNGGNSGKPTMWRTLTKDEWLYIINTRTGDDASVVASTPNARYAKATINTDINGGVTGLILFPASGTFASGEFTNVGSINKTSGALTSTTCTSAQWLALEAKGCVFLPLEGRRNGTSRDDTTQGYYWSSTGVDSDYAYGFLFSGSRCEAYNVNKKMALGVRLVQDMPDELKPEVPKAYTSKAPIANNLTYIGSSQSLVTAAGYATGGTVKYKLSTSESWNTSCPSATIAGDYIVQWFVDHTGNSQCYVSSDVQEIHVTIKRASASAPSPMPTIEAATLTYNGSAQDLVTTTGSIQSGYTTVYSTDGVNWSSTIPQGTNAGDYTVYYKFYKGDNYEYVPSPNTIDASIAKADLPGVILPASTSTIPYDGTEKTLLEIDPVANATIWYKLGSGEWTTTPPTRTDAGDYSVQYKIVPDDEVNYNTIGPETVTVTIVDYPTITDQTADDATIASILTGLTDPWQLKVKRIIYADGEYNTICLPFALDASALAASPLAGFNNLKTIKGASVTGSGQALSIDIFVEDVTEMEAGKPYLISYPSAHADIVDPVFQLSSTTSYELHAGSVTADGVTFKGMFAQVHIDPYTNERDEDYLFLGANSQLMWPNNDASYMRGFRAYFIIDRNAIPAQVAPRGTHARFVNAPKQPTSIENTELYTQAQKLLENGQLIILKNGIKYNAQGQVLK